MVAACSKRQCFWRGPAPPRLDEAKGEQEPARQHGWWRRIQGQRSLRLLEEVLQQPARLSLVGEALVLAFDPASSELVTDWASRSQEQEEGHERHYLAFP